MKKIAVLVLALILALSAAALAEFPEKQITVVCPYAAGGASDTTSRIYAAMLQEIAGVPVIVDNRTGANGSVGMEFGAHSDPDGYTITYMPVESVLNKFEGRGEITTDDFSFIGLAMTIPAAITVRADSEWETFEDFLAYAKENPGDITVGNSGAGSIWHVAAAVVEDVCDIELDHIPYPDGAAAAIAGLLGGEIDAVAVSGAEVSTYVADGTLKTLVILGSNRCSAESLKDVPTAKELGYEVAVEGWGGFAVPAGTDEAVVAKLVELSTDAINSDDMKELLASKGYEHSYMDGAAADAYAKAQLDYYSELLPTLELG
ncbi:MAG: tripartite tricarboxylate transporter substrate binding protein [Clostridia bacterium]|nr:tripartite tricarboxylate transporter substrate binding protein [Clostridia bacterium]